MTIEFHNPKNHATGTAAREEFEETLRLVAALPAPEGLEERVHQRLSAAPRTAKRGLLAWPAPLSSMRMGAGRDWVRTAAAAAIAFVIVGGGWGVYRQAQPRQAAGGVPVVPHGPVGGGFAGAGAKRTPQTLNGPVVSGPVAAESADPHPAQGAAPSARAAAKKGAGKNAAHSAPVHAAQP